MNDAKNCTSERKPSLSNFADDSLAMMIDAPLDDTVATAETVADEIRRLGTAYLNETTYRAEFDRRTSSDWMHAFFFAFDEADMQRDLETLLNLVERTYDPLLREAKLRRSNANADLPNEIFDDGTNANRDKPSSSGQASVADLILDTFAEIRAIDDCTIKQFAMLFAMAEERAAQVTVCSRCDRRRADRTMQWLTNRGIEKIRNQKFNEFNAVDVVERFVREAAERYVVGCTTTASDRSKTRERTEDLRDRNAKRSRRR